MTAAAKAMPALVRSARALEGAGAELDPGGWGALDLITSIEARDVNSAWRPGVIAGMLQMLIGLWASQQLFSSDRRCEIFVTVSR